MCFKKYILWFALVVFSVNVFAHQHSKFKQWHQVQAKSPLAISFVNETSVNDIATHFTTEIDQLRALLIDHQNQTLLISLPLPTGELIDVKLTPWQVMAPELASRYPMIKAFKATLLNEQAEVGRIDVTPNGFHAMFSYKGDVVFIEPNRDGEAEQYISYFRSATNRLESTSKIIKREPNTQTELTRVNDARVNDTSLNQILPSAKKASQNILSTIRTYRFAVSAVGEYTQYHGGTKTSALAEIVTMVNRLNQVFERDFGVNLQLIANNDAIIFTHANSDPYSNSDSDESINTRVINDIIGSTNYDIGHVVGTGGGGLATLGGVCFDTYKGNGVTGAPRPINDSFYIDYVAHELGHQFNASHSFNGTGGGCSGNRISNYAYEPGSGSTIMSYAGICGSENLQNAVDPYFHTSSISVVEKFLSDGWGARCGSESVTANNVPVVDAGANYTIPANSPFILTGSASDSDGDDLTYSWQQYDLGNASFSASSMIDDGSRPIFRSYAPVSLPIRTLPQMNDVLLGRTSTGESYPTTDRRLNFRLLTRDNKGGVSFDTMQVSVVNTHDTFAVISPSTSDVWRTNEQNVRWQVAGTHSNGINCAAIDILLSVDNGDNFDRVLASGVTNDGAQQISLSGVTTSQARLKIVCSDNIFFAVSGGNFDINIAAVLRITGQQSLSMTQGGSLSLTPNMFTYQDAAAQSLLINAGNNYSFTGKRITANENFIGTLMVAVIGVNNGNESEVFLAEITVNEAPPVINPTTPTNPVPTTPTPTSPAPTTPTTSEAENSSSGASMWLFLLLCYGLFIRQIKD